MDFLPVSFRISDKKILMVGGGKVASHKSLILSRFTKNVTVVAPEISKEIKALPFHFEERPFSDSDLDGVSIAFICTGDTYLNHSIKTAASRRGVPASVCDDTLWCDFISPAISRREGDSLTIAVSSDAKDVRRSIRVRNRIDKLIEEGLLDLS